MTLSSRERSRYQRHLSLPGIGPAGQARLKSARVLVIGAGGLGSPAALYLSAAGVGTLGIVDCDRVDLSNLQRQVLFESRDVGRLKAEAARDRLTALNPEISGGRPAVFVCRSGGRGLAACAIALRAGVVSAAHLEGGLLAWAAEADPDFEVAPA